MKSKKMFSEGAQSHLPEPMARWESADADPAVLAQRLRFPYACNVIAPNRFMKSAMSEQLATFDQVDMMKSGIPTRELTNLYEKFADGGYGIIVTGSIMVNGTALEAPGNVIFDKTTECEERRTAVKDWTQAAKKHGSVFLAQLLHPGQKAMDLPNKTAFDVNSWTPEQITTLVEQYASAATFAQECGFDGIEISCAYSYALGEFLNDSVNKRTDDFGGSLENRSRVLFKIIQATRMKVRRPNSFAIGLKLSSGNFEPAFDKEHFAQFIRGVEKTGFDYIAITGGHFYLLKGMKEVEAVTKKRENFYQSVVPAIKKNLTRTKLYMNGGFVTLADMCEAINDGWAMGVSLGRPVAAEPGLASQLLKGEAKAAVKSVIDPLDFGTTQQLAGTQLWQHGWFLPVTDASNPDQVSQFKEDLAMHQDTAQSEHNEPVVGYAKSLVGKGPSATAAIDGVSEKSTKELATEDIKLDADKTQKPGDEHTEMTEEETHHVVKKQLDYADAPMELHEVEDSLHTVVKSTRSDEYSSIEIVEETIEKVVTSDQVFTQPPSHHTDGIPSSAPVEDIHGAKKGDEEGVQITELPPTPEPHDSDNIEIAHEVQHDMVKETSSNEKAPVESADAYEENSVQKLFDSIAQKAEKLAHDVAEKVEGVQDMIEEVTHKETHRDVHAAAPADTSRKDEQAEEVSRKDLHNGTEALISKDGYSDEHTRTVFGAALEEETQNTGEASQSPVEKTDVVAEPVGEEFHKVKHEAVESVSHDIQQVEEEFHQVEQMVTESAPHEIAPVEKESHKDVQEVIDIAPHDVPRVEEEFHKVEQGVVESAPHETAPVEEESHKVVQEVIEPAPHDVQQVEEKFQKVEQGVVESAPHETAPVEEESHKIVQEVIEPAPHDVQQVEEEFHKVEQGVVESAPHETAPVEKESHKVVQKIIESASHDAQQVEEEFHKVEQGAVESAPHETAPVDEESHKVVQEVIEPAPHDVQQVEEEFHKVEQGVVESAPHETAPVEEESHKIVQHVVGSAPVKNNKEDIASKPIQQDSHEKTCDLVETSRTIGLEDGVIEEIVDEVMHKEIHHVFEESSAGPDEKKEVVSDVIGINLEEVLDSSEKSAPAMVQGGKKVQANEEIAPKEVNEVITDSASSPTDEVTAETILVEAVAAVEQVSAKTIDPVSRDSAAKTTDEIIEKDVHINSGASVSANAVENVMTEKAGEEAVQDVNEIPAAVDIKVSSEKEKSGIKSPEHAETETVDGRVPVSYLVFTEKEEETKANSEVHVEVHEDAKPVSGEETIKVTDDVKIESSDKKEGDNLTETIEEPCVAVNTESLTAEKSSKLEKKIVKESLNEKSESDEVRITKITLERGNELVEEHGPEMEHSPVEGIKEGVQKDSKEKEPINAVVSAMTAESEPIISGITLDDQSTHVEETSTESKKNVQEKEVAVEIISGINSDNEPIVTGLAFNQEHGDDKATSANVEAAVSESVQADSNGHEAESEVECELISGMSSASEPIVSGIALNKRETESPKPKKTTPEQETVSEVITVMRTGNEPVAMDESHADTAVTPAAVNASTPEEESTTAVVSKISSESAVAVTDNTVDVSHADEEVASKKTSPKTVAVNEVISGISSENEPIIAGVVKDEARWEPEGAAHIEVIEESKVTETPAKGQNAAPIGTVIEEYSEIVTKVTGEYIPAEKMPKSHDGLENVLETFEEKQSGEPINAEGEVTEPMSTFDDNSDDISHEFGDALSKITGSSFSDIDSLDRVLADSKYHESSSTVHGKLFGSSAANDEPLEQSVGLTRAHELPDSLISSAVPHAVVEDHSSQHEKKTVAETATTTTVKSGSSDAVHDEHDATAHHEGEKKSHGFSFITSALPDSVSSLFSSKKTTKTTTKHEETAEEVLAAEEKKFEDAFDKLEAAASEMLEETFDRSSSAMKGSDSRAVEDVSKNGEGSQGASRSEVKKDSGVLSEKSDFKEAEGSSDVTYRHEKRVVMETRNGKTHGYVLEKSNDKEGGHEMDFEFIH